MSPMEIKDVGDLAFSQGTNRYFLHCSAHQPNDYWPGSYGGEGLKFNRNNPWFTMSRGFMDNIARTQFLLQRGAFYADVLNFAGTSVPTDIDLDKSLSTPVGYRDLSVNSDALIKFADVKDGRIVLPTGTSFAVMTLPAGDGMDIESLKKIEELVSKGATIVGQKPVREKTLKNYPACDAEIKKLADRIWQNCDGTRVKKVKYGKGNVYWNVPMQEILSDLHILPDFEYKVDSDKRLMVFNHRTDVASGSEIYFVSNCENSAVKAVLTFGKPRKYCEIWHTEFGEIFPCKYELLKDGRAQVALELSPKESLLVVFRDEQSRNYSPSANLDRHALTEIKTIGGTWNISFACTPVNMKPPKPFTSDHLFRLDESDNDELKYFSGYITYENEFVFDKKSLSAASRVVLDLGEVNMLADLYLNGKKVASLWRPPFACDVTENLKDGKNTIKVVVVNHLDNRIIGDLKLPKEQRVVKLTIDNVLTGYRFRNEKPMPSGLVGPVTLELGRR